MDAAELDAELTVRRVLSGGRSVEAVSRDGTKWLVGVDRGSAGALAAGERVRIVGASKLNPSLEDERDEVMMVVVAPSGLHRR